MEDLPVQDLRSANKNEKDDKILHNNHRPTGGVCRICRMPPVHSKNYFGHVFCTDCFYKYIFSQSKNDCSGDITKKEKSAKDGKKELKEGKKDLKDDKKGAKEDTVDVSK